MKNPFDIKTEEERHLFFKQITKSIDDWMLEKYPSFDTRLEQKIKYITQQHQELNDFLSKADDSFKRIEANMYDNLVKKINKFLKEEYPDISSELANRVKKFEHVIKTHEDNGKSIQKKLKEIIQSDSIYKDVYSLRDEMTILKSDVVKFTDKLKKVFS